MGIPLDLTDPAAAWRLPIGVNFSDLVAVGAHAPPRTEGRCIPRLQIYRMSAQTDRLLVWRSIRCDAGTKRTLNTLGLKTSLGGSTRTGSRSSPRVSAHLAIIPFLGPRTEPF
jgi:hypothetical protein